MHDVIQPISDDDGDKFTEHRVFIQPYLAIQPYPECDDGAGRRDIDQQGRQIGCIDQRQQEAETE